MRVRLQLYPLLLPREKGSGKKVGDEFSIFISYKLSAGFFFFSLHILDSFSPRGEVESSAIVRLFLVFLPNIHDSQR